MSTESSEQMMELLKELALLKQMDQKEEGGELADVNISELESRENRRREISEQIKALGEGESNHRHEADESAIKAAKAADL